VVSCIATILFAFHPGLYIHSIDTLWARAEVFISATTRELRSHREEVKNALLTLGIFPIEQTNFRLAHGPLTAKLRSLIAPCDALRYQRPIGLLVATGISVHSLKRLRNRSRDGQSPLFVMVFS
jgi:hypothetical protein